MSEDTQNINPDVISHPIDIAAPAQPPHPPFYQLHLRRVLSDHAKTEEDIRTDAKGLTATPQSTESSKKKYARAN